MRRLSAEAIVLDVVDLQERDRVVTFLTGEWGRKRGVARGARAKYSRFAGQLQPLSKVAVRWFEQEGRELVRIESLELVHPCRALLEDLDGILLASCLAEHLVCFAQENEESEALYRLLDGTLAWLEQGVDRDLAARYFEVWVLRLSGIFPPPRECPVCGRALAAAGGAALQRRSEEIRCRDCAPEDEAGVSPAAIRFLLRTARETPPSMTDEALVPAVLREVERVCARVRTAFLHQELRSYEVLEATRRRERELAREVAERPPE
ncbi:MAG TPA: DNA repair protein RecO [Thermoanaerobaculia bacterium]|nr:DNA repair protein RecO [Thermoanaerobaculia bacterium]